MRFSPLHDFFLNFFESSFHLDSLLSKLDPKIKSKVAQWAGAFLRRPWTVATHLGVELASSREAFWAQSAGEIKTNPGVNEALRRLWTYSPTLPSEGGEPDFPPEMFESWVSDWGQATACQLARLLTQDPSTVIRYHRRFGGSRLEGSSRPGFYSSRGAQFKGYASVMRTDQYHDGEFEIQDEGSQVMSGFALSDADWAPALQAAPTLRRPTITHLTWPPQWEVVQPLVVVDACSGSGGKTLAMADMMQGRGQIFAYDIYPQKIQSLKKRAQRAQERNIKAICVSPSLDLSPYWGTADRLLLDVPCSGWGVLRRNPDLRWPRAQRRESLEPRAAAWVPLEQLQKDLVGRYLPVLKRGGIFTFGVCTFQKSQTLHQIDWIQEQFPHLRLRHQGFVGPHETDGFFMASFERAD